jgi:hypothetical protein
MVWRESDLLVVLRRRESRSQGEGADRKTQPTQETWSGLPCRSTQANLTEGNSDEDGNVFCGSESF